MTHQGQGARARAAAHARETLPATIAFLAEHGVPPATLREATRRARLAGVDSAACLMAEGLLDPESYYRALARHLGAPYLTRPELAADTAFPDAVLAGVAPLAGTEGPSRFVGAPDPSGIARLLAARAAPEGYAITAPDALREAVFAARAGLIADEAANALPEADPSLSFKGGTERAQRRALAGFAVAAAIVAAASPWLGFALATGGLGILFLVLANLRIAACLERTRPYPSGRARRRRDDELPVYTVVVALYREENVAAALVAALDRIDYPKALIDLKFVVEEGDDATRAALARACGDRACEIIVAPPGAPRTKPRALNMALALARGEYLVVYDAEDAPEEDQLRLAVDIFAQATPKVACLQARLAIDNIDDGFLPRCFAIEYAALFDVVNPGLARLGLPILLGGTSNHFRTVALRAVCGWDAWNVTEDADLGMRLALCGYAVRDLPSTTWEEAPARYGAWAAQRRRWMKGFMQTAITHSRRPLRAFRALGLTGFACGVAGTLGAALAAMLYPVFLALALLAGATAAGAAVGIVPPWLAYFSAMPDVGRPLAVASTAIGAVTFAAGFVSMTAPLALGLWRRRWFSLMLWLPAMPIYYLLVSRAAWGGLSELARAPNHWNKTEHGLSRRRRRR
ncbi:MAG: glycosyltransferase [Salinarimonadaceae bacterium]|nr:MAG: glycosyltransferase [Salinarimonadaceae bacterium]